MDVVKDKPKRAKITLITGPAGSGKSEAALKLLAEMQQDERHLSVRYILPTKQAVSQAEARLMGMTGERGVFGNLFTTFFTFSQELLAEGRVVSEVMSDERKMFIVRETLRGVRFRALAGSSTFPGFDEAVFSLIGQLKTEHIKPDRFREAVVATEGKIAPEAAMRLSELAEVYERYQSTLFSNNLVDREGVLWLAVDKVKDSSIIGDLSIAIVDGFHSLTGVQRRMLSAIIDRGRDVRFLLDRDAERAELFKCEEPLLEYLTGLGAVEAEHPGTSPHGFAALAGTLFSDARECVDLPDDLFILRAGDRFLEARLLAEEVTKLQGKGMPLSDIAIVDPGEGYLGLLRDVFKDSGIGLREAKRQLSSTCFGRLARDAIGCMLTSWSRPSVMAYLRSPLVSGDEAEAVSRISEGAVVNAVKTGRDSWNEPWKRKDGFCKKRSDWLKSLKELDIAYEAAKDCRQAAELLKTFIAGIKPRLGCGEDEKLQAAASDITAKRTIIEIIDDIVGIDEKLGSGLTPREILYRIASAIGEKEITMGVPEADAVSIVGKRSLTALSFPALFVPAMTENHYPRKHREDACIRDKERTLINAYLKTFIRDSVIDQAEERYLFYRLIASAGNSLALSFPSIDLSNREVQPSFYIDDLGDVIKGDIPERERTLSACILPLERVFNGDELNRSLIYWLTHEPAESPAARLAGAVYNALFERLPPETIEAIVGMSRGPELSDPDIISILSDPEKHFSHSQLATMMRCPFQYFAFKVLALKQVSEEFSALEQGTLFHDVLHAIYSSVRDDEGYCDLPDWTEEEISKRVLAAIDRVTEDKESFLQLNERERSFFRKRLSERLVAFLKREQEWSDRSHRPRYLELGFGPGLYGDRDAASTDEALILRDSAGRTAGLSGKIDRVDIGPDGAVLIDYKSGTVKDPLLYVDEANGDFQLPLYALACKRLFGMDVEGIQYRSLAKLMASGIVAEGVSRPFGNISECADIDSLLAEIEEFAMGLVESIRSGTKSLSFKGFNHTHCSFCDYPDLCRWWETNDAGEMEE